MEDLETIIQKIAREAVKEEIAQLREQLKPTHPDIDSGGIELAQQITGLSKSTIYKLVHRRKIPCSKPAGTKQLRFSRSTLEEWVNSGQQKTEEELTMDSIKLNRI